MTGGILSQLVLPLCLFIIMLGMGLTLSPGDFTRIFRFPRPALAGLGGQMLLLPLVGFALAAWLMPTPALAIGLVLLAACPGGVTSNMVTYMARGDLALSVTLTAVSSLLAVISIPLLVGWAFLVFDGGYQSVRVPVLQMMLSLILMTLLPIALGMWIRARNLRLALWLEPKISLFGMLFLAVLILGVLYRQGDQVATGLMSSGVAIIALNLVMMALGMVSALLLRLDGAQATSITLETGIQNSTLAMLIATSFLQDEQLAVPAALYSLVMYVTATLVVVYRRRGMAISAKVAVQD
ncbi:MAG: bile acid:sodium symporter [Gammaproteobacteria bacterium HGW-Gammaproteobacteria-11]|nr:MAG: bile acid:sodium symporter [Gammaproteobacteria bacterium HGW-Gammaproteobacteria-11]